ncbi:MAG TPA: methyltransferase domain-containing protein [Planctomycetota bacterium]|nr:methyltransferase domain-containing protein [Planctomycetota bacterium]
MPELLACPVCSGPLRNQGTQLRCGCASWPVVADIPVLLPWARNQSPSTGDMLARSRAPATGLFDKVLRRLFPGGAALENTVSRRDATFLDLAAELGRTHDLDYFRYRFSDLSYIATAALLTPLSRGPVLDLGCGAGHGVHALSRRLPRSLVAGLDANFALLYLAKRFLAPSALLVCADAALRLPFLDGVFEAVLSADTFQYLADGTPTTRELLRVSRGPILLSHFRASGPFDAGSCLELLRDRSPLLHDEEAILETFFTRRELDLGPRGPGQTDAVTITAGVEGRCYSGADYFVSGSMINPVYDVHEEGEILHLQRRFLSLSHEVKHRKFESWLPERLTATREQIASRDPVLVRTFVLLDLPPNYC